MKRFQHAKPSLQCISQRITLHATRQDVRKKNILGANANSSTHFLDHIVLHATFFAQTHTFSGNTTQDRQALEKLGRLPEGRLPRGSSHTNHGSRICNEETTGAYAPFTLCQDRAADSIPSFSQLIERHGLLSPRSNKTLITWTKRRAVICTSALRSGCC